MFFMQVSQLFAIHNHSVQIQTYIVCNWCWFFNKFSGTKDTKFLWIALRRIIRAHNRQWAKAVRRAQTSIHVFVVSVFISTGAWWWLSFHMRRSTTKDQKSRHSSGVRCVLPRIFEYDTNNSCSFSSRSNTPEGNDVNSLLYSVLIVRIYQRRHHKKQCSHHMDKSHFKSNCIQ